jgi:hypothetical protein
MTPRSYLSSTTTTPPKPSLNKKIIKRNKKKQQMLENLLFLIIHLHKTYTKWWTFSYFYYRHFQSELMCAWTRQNKQAPLEIWNLKFSIVHPEKKIMFEESINCNMTSFWIFECIYYTSTIIFNIYLAYKLRNTRIYKYTFSWKYTAQ